VGGVGEATNATGLPTAARRSTQHFGDLTFGISLVHRKLFGVHYFFSLAYFFHEFYEATFSRLRVTYFYGQYIGYKRTHPPRLPAAK
jgi:hypothetical protein